MGTRPARDRSPFATYIAEVDQTPLLTGEEERELAFRVQEGDEFARDQFVRANLRFVIMVARKYIGKGLNLEDLVSEGNIGLMRAVEGYDPSAGTRFATYAVFWIRQSIRRALSRDANTLRLPSYIWTLLTKWHRTRGTLQRELGREATEEEISTRLKLSKRQTSAVRKAMNVMASGQASCTEQEGAIERTASTSCRNPVEELDSAEQVTRAVEGIADLDERESTIIRLRYGLDGRPVSTLKEVGKRLGYTRERIRQIELIALAKLRERVAA